MVYGNKVILWLICPVLHGDIPTTSCELASSKSFGCSSDMPRVPHLSNASSIVGLTLPLSGRQGVKGGGILIYWRPVHSRGLLCSF